MPSASRLPELGPHGEGWVVLQLLLGAAIAGSGFVGVYWPGSVESFVGVLGLLLALVGALLVVLGVLSLGKSFTPLPRNNAQRRRVTVPPNRDSPALRHERTEGLLSRRAGGDLLPTRGRASTAQYASRRVVGADKRHVHLVVADLLCHHIHTRAEE